jgi:uncharacterized membrane protein
MRAFPFFSLYSPWLMPLDLLFARSVQFLHCHASSSSDQCFGTGLPWTLDAEFFLISLQVCLLIRRVVCLRRVAPFASITSPRQVSSLTHAISFGFFCIAVLYRDSFFSFPFSSSQFVPEVSLDSFRHHHVLDTQGDTGVCGEQAAA